MATSSSRPFAQKPAMRISLGEGVVYPVLHALERDDPLKARRKAVNGRTRVYYTVTRNGEKRLGGTCPAMDPSHRHRQPRDQGDKPCPSHDLIN